MGPWSMEAIYGRATPKPQPPTASATCQLRANAGRRHILHDTASPPLKARLNREGLHRKCDDEGALANMLARGMPSPEGSCSAALNAEGQPGLEVETKRSSSSRNARAPLHPRVRVRVRMSVGLRVLGLGSGSLHRREAPSADEEMTRGVGLEPEWSKTSYGDPKRSKPMDGSGASLSTAR